jgi:GNAT superfamily N-acetyltransferase
MGIRVANDEIRLRIDFAPSDIEAIIALHAELYQREFAFDESFLDHVAEPLRQFALTTSPGNRLWIAEKAGKVVGSIAIVEHAPTVARLRWFLVDPKVRRIGLGRRLIEEAIAFCKSNGCDSVILWTVSLLTTAANLYRAVGFRKTIEKPGRMGGVAVIEEMYELNPIP